MRHSKPDLWYNVEKYERATDEVRGMKILQVLPALGQGGVERGTVEIARALAGAGIPNAVASAGGRLVHALDELGVEHLRLPLDRKNPFTLRSCAKKISSS